MHVCRSYIALVLLSFFAGVADARLAKPPVLPQLALGDNFACLLAGSQWTEGRPQVKCWGMGVYHYGHGEELKVPLFKRATAIAATKDTVCVVDDSRVRCWGYKDEAKPEQFPSKLEKAFAPFKDVTALASGPHILCATDYELGAKCVEHDGAFETVSALAHPVKMAVGYAYACAVSELGRADCWQIMRGGRPTCGQKSEKPPASLGPITDLAISSYGYANGCSICALSGNQMQCWGSEEKPETVYPLTAPKAIAQIDLSQHEGRGSACVIEDKQVKCRDKEGKFQAFDGYSDLADPIVFAGHQWLSCAANQAAMKCLFGNHFQKNVVRVPHGIWFAPFHLYELESVLAKIAGQVYSHKAEVFRAAHRATRYLISSEGLQGKERERLLLFVMNALYPMVELNDAELFARFLKPNWDALLARHNAAHSVASLRDFARSTPTILATLEIIRGTRLSLQSMLVTPEQVARLDDFIASVGKAIALKGSTGAIADLLFQYDLIRPDVVALSTMPRHRAVALQVMTLMEYLKP